MFNSEITRECLSSLIGWKDHYDLTEVGATPDDMKVSDTGEFYQEKHPAMRLDLIQASLPPNRDLFDYLKETEDSAITEVLNDIVIARQMAKTTKEIVANDIIYNTEGWINNLIVNESRFVGIRFRPVHEIGLKATINRLALQMTQPQEGLKIYLYHSHRAEPIHIFEYSTTQGGQFNWKEIDWDLKADDFDLSGGSFFIGYYQDDVVGQAVKYDKLNWKTGYCGTCDGGVNQTRYTTIYRYVNMQSFYVPSANLDVDRNMFDPTAVIETDSTNWGFNFNVSVNCDLSVFWCDNRKSLRTAIGLRVVYKILKDISFSNQINHIEEQLKMMIIRDLEGDNETRYINIADQYEKSLKALKFDHSSLSSICLPCSVNSGVTYGVM